MSEEERTPGAGGRGRRQSASDATRLVDADEVKLEHVGELVPRAVGAGRGLERAEQLGGLKGEDGTFFTVCPL